jgi:hypothetical protein
MAFTLLSPLDAWSTSEWLTIMARRSRPPASRFVHGTYVKHGRCNTMQHIDTKNVRTCTVL